MNSINMDAVMAPGPAEPTVGSPERPGLTRNSQQYRFEAADIAVWSSIKVEPEGSILSHFPDFH
jgi:hypothetical protein